MNRDPLVSVILPVRNEERYIRGAIQSVADQTYPASRLEIIVVDGRSTDRTRWMVSEFLNKYPNVHLLDNPGKIVPTGLNLAMKKARGEIVIRVDGHCRIAHDYVQKCVNYLKNNRVDGVGGSIATIGVTRSGKAIAAAISSRFGVGNSAFRTKTGETLAVDTIPFPAYTRRAMERIGPYDEGMLCNEDDEYNYRLREHGGILHLAADIHSIYYARNTLKELWFQYYRYGFWKVRIFQKHPSQIQIRQLVPPIFVSVLLMATLAFLISPFGKYILPSICVSYLLANLGETLTQIRKKAASYAYILPVVYIVLHFSYGLGFLLGLLHFLDRWTRQGVQTTDCVKSYE